MIELRYAKFVNFEPFNVNMNLTELEINIPAGANIIIINGENGSGKSTLMRSMLPFGRPERTSDIIDGKDGYKILKYIDTDTNTWYEINHVYTAVKHGHTIQSHIFSIGVDGERLSLNPNGNVGSFNDALETVFGVNDKTKKLLNLSLTDKGLINLTTSERRNYVYSILPDMEEMDNYSKTVLTKYRAVNKEMEATKLKLSKYPDLDKMKQDLLHYEQKTERLHATVIELSEQVGRFSVMEEQYSSMADSKSVSENKIASIYSSIAIIESIKIDGEYINEDRVVDDIVTTCINLKYDNGLMLQRKEMEKLDTVATVIDLNESMNDIDDIVDVIDEIKLLTDDIHIKKEQGYDVPQSKYSYNEHKDAESVINEVVCVLGRALENVDNKSNFIERLLSSGDLRSGYNSELTVLSEKRNRATVLHSLIKNKKDSVRDYVMLLDESVKNCTCKLKDFIDEKVNSIGDMDILEDELRVIEYDIAVMEDQMVDYGLAVDTQHDIELIMKSHSVSVVNPVITQFKNDMYDIITNCNTESYYQDFKTRMERTRIYEEYNSQHIRLKELLSFKKISGVKDKIELESELVLLNDRISTIDIEIRDLQSSISSNDKIIKQLTNIDLVHRCSTKKQLIIESSHEDKKLLALNVKLLELDNMLETKRQLDRDKESINKEIAEFRIIILGLHNNINMTETLSEELEVLVIEEREIGMIKDIIRVKLPMKIMQHFLNVVKESSNDFLVSTGSKYKISEFRLTDSEFIVEVVNGTYMNRDISSMSEGEKAIISLALTFGMQNALLGKYKIMMLDEVDAPLDQDNRKRYLDILFRQSINYGISQIFLVTHNDNFNDHSDRIHVIALKGANVKDRSQIIYDYNQ
ncbi:MAG: hypothetical protein ACRCZ9_12075 [Fusobacteriaceae bacterium]